MHRYPEEILFSIVLGTALLLFFVVLFVFIVLQFQKKQLRNKLEQSQMQKEYDQAILHVQLEVQNKTMQHIAEELHDNIGQLLSIARIHLNEVEESGVDEEYVVSVKEANELIAQSLLDLRSLTKSLDSDFLKDFGLVESVAQELRRIKSTRVFNTELTIEGAPYSLGGKHDIVVFRVVQEILQNCIKHSKAKELTAQITFGTDAFTLTVADNGKGFDAGRVNDNGLSQSGAGLRNIKRRVALLGGNCTIDSSPGNGTRVTILLPGQKNN